MCVPGMFPVGCRKMCVPVSLGVKGVCPRVVGGERCVSPWGVSPWGKGAQGEVKVWGRRRFAPSGRHLW